MQRGMSHRTIEILQRSQPFRRRRSRLPRGTIIVEIANTTTAALETVYLLRVGAGVGMPDRPESRMNVHTHGQGAKAGQSTLETRETARESEVRLHRDRDLSNHQKKESKCRSSRSRY